MGMDKDRLGGKIWTFVKSISSFGSAMTPAADAKGLELWTGIADEIIQEIQQHAVVTSVTSTPGAQAGPSVLPGSATGTVE